jgi:hypothetical protein
MESMIRRLNLRLACLVAVRRGLDSNLDMSIPYYG